MKLFSRDPIFIESEKQFLQVFSTYKLIQKVQFICTECGKLETIQLRSQRIYPQFCVNCSRKHTFLDKYGIESVGQSKEFLERAKRTCKERYGVENPFQSKIIKEKIQETCLKKYGVTNPRKNIEIINKAKETCIERYGVDNPAKVDIVKDKMQKTCLERYGVKNASQSEYIKNKKKETLYKNYGVYHPMSGRYIYNNEYFDSSWELAFYIYHLMNGDKIIREPKAISYMYNNELHNYYPDFEVNGDLYEIKGNHLINSNGELTNIFSEDQDDILKEKYKCMIQNNVILITKKEIKVYMDFIKSKNINLRDYKK